MLSRLVDMDLSKHYAAEVPGGYGWHVSSRGEEMF